MRKVTNMGTPILPELVDAEIEDIVNDLLNESFDYMQTINSSSGWSGIKSNISDGVNRIWRGNPFITISIDDNSKFFTIFLPYILTKMVYDSRTNLRKSSKYLEYKSRLETYNIIDDTLPLINVNLEYREGKIEVTIHIVDTNRQPEYIEKIWNLFRSVLTDYINNQSQIKTKPVR